MKLSDFNYDLPKELVAEYPNKTRDEAKLMVIDRKDYSIQHRQFKDMIEYFIEEDIIIVIIKCFFYLCSGIHNKWSVLITRLIDGFPLK